MATPRAADAAVPGPSRVTTPAPRPEAHASTRITTTDYGHVVGELKRIALLTVLIVAILLVLWLLVG